MPTQFELPSLPYAYDALEPHIDETTMRIHHMKHHAGYATKLNAALADAKMGDIESAEALIQSLDKVPEKVHASVRNNGGGYVNHNLFWTSMSPDGGGEPKDELGKAIQEKFGGFDAFRTAFADAAKGRFGSGWAWLVTDDTGTIRITDTPNQDSPLMHGHVPILGLDVWEHAYYLKYQNRRPDYIDAWWKVVDWTSVASRYEAAALTSAKA